MLLNDAPARPFIRWRTAASSIAAYKAGEVATFSLEEVLAEARSTAP